MRLTLFLLGLGIIWMMFWLQHRFTKRAALRRRAAYDAACLKRMNDEVTRAWMQKLHHHKQGMDDVW